MTRATDALKKFDEAAKPTHPTAFTVMQNLTLVYDYRGSDKTIWIPEYASHEIDKARNS